MIANDKGMVWCIHHFRGAEELSDSGITVPPTGFDTFSE